MRRHPGWGPGGLRAAWDKEMDLRAHRATEEYVARRDGPPWPARPDGGMKMSEYVIVSRHPAGVEFARKHCPDKNAPVYDAVTPDQVRGKIVLGNVPLHLAAVAAEVWAIEFPAAPPRGQEYTLADMEAAGARIARYSVTAL